MLAMTPKKFAMLAAIANISSARSNVTNDF